MAKEDITNPAAVSEIISSFDYDEDITIATADIDLDSATDITDFTGVASRDDYYCRGIHNPTSSPVTIKYQLFEQVGTAYRTAYIQPGQTIIFYLNVKVIGGSTNGSSAGIINIKWKKREYFNIKLHHKL